MIDLENVIKTLVETGYRITSPKGDIIGYSDSGPFEDFLKGKYFHRTGSNAFVKWKKFETFEEAIASFLGESFDENLRS